MTGRLSKELRVVPRKRTFAPQEGERTNLRIAGMSSDPYVSSACILSLAVHWGNVAGSRKADAGFETPFEGPPDAAMFFLSNESQIMTTCQTWFFIKDIAAVWTEGKCWPQGQGGVVGKFHSLLPDR